MTVVPGLKHPIAILESFSDSRFSKSFRFEGLEKTVIAYLSADVLRALNEVESAVAQGRHAVGFVSYEAANGLNPDLAVMESALEVPLVWFAIFAERRACAAGEDDCGIGSCDVSLPVLDIDQIAYVDGVEQIREAIAAGETYQVNFTTRQRFNVTGDPFQLYRSMCRNQQAPFCAWLDIGTHRILSASPELFFSLENNLLTMKPMKGTAPRMPRSDNDLQQRGSLAQSVKNRAENLMIVDLVRNDLATLAEIGSVAVTSLFDVETFPTVHQMTSTVTARIRPEIRLVDIFCSLFPCGSVTGAPKRRTMEIIKGLETARGVYCGAIGYISPGSEAVFSVAIRTAVVEPASGNGVIGIGSGITWGSDPESEFNECLNKSAFMFRDCSTFQLIESLRFDEEGYLLLDRHLQRLADSAAYFGFILDEAALRARLCELGSKLTGVNKVRIILDQDGSVAVEAIPISVSKGTTGIATIKISQESVDSQDPFLYHKTSRRALYDRELLAHPECYDLIFTNERNEMTEGSFNTLIILLEDELLTPAISCGLLPGVLRGELLDAGAISESILTPDKLYRAEKIW
ncbi:MAG: aminodeoxychorismate synthase, component I, partial [Geobacteraceae bacterium GWC2_48_7]